MPCPIEVSCNDDKRRAAVAAAGAPVNGIKAIEIVKKPSGDPLEQRVLAIYFFHGIPAGLDNSHLERFKISGGVRVKGFSIRVIDAAPMAGHLQLTLDRYGDFSTYTLDIDSPDLDAIYRCRKFSFKVDCPNQFDCEPPPGAPVPLPPDPAIDYLCKDYRSFRRALLDFLTLRSPGFDESNEADLAVTLAELFAYTGDQLSYFQDAVANEAFLETARQRLSVKRHARLADFRMHDGLAARTILQFEVAQPTVIPKGWQVRSPESPTEEAIVFETEEQITAEPEQQRIPIHTWLNTQCCLPRGATVAYLARKLTTLHKGDKLAFQEVLGPVRVNENDFDLQAGAADRNRRQIVTLTAEPEVLIDPLQPAGQQEVTRVRWDGADALRFDFCLEHDNAGNPASLAHGNLAWASHGETIHEDLSGHRLSQGPLTWLAPVGSTDAVLARSTVELLVDGRPWNEQESLLDSGPNDPVFVVDTDLSGRGIIRFGDGELGRQLPTGSHVEAIYRIGNGTKGNIGADVLNRPKTPIGGVSVTNLLPATGGIDPQDMVEVRRDAPEAFRRVQFRAVTSKDYADAAKTVAGVSSAVATFRWTGSWLTVFVAIDPSGRAELLSTLRAGVFDRLDRRRQAGYDLNLQPPRYVPLDIELIICVLPGYFQGDVLRAVNDVLSARTAANGDMGFFHPDRFTFGQSLYVSQLYAAIQRVAGVRAAHATKLKRLNQPDYGELDAGVLTVGPYEVIRLDNDPSAPDFGLLKLTPEGGK